jgi:MFS superfamily sulfate permease-like transporter
LTSAFIFITFSTGIQTLNNYGFDVERSELWSGIAALCALFFTMGINKILPAIFAAIFAAYGFIVAGLLFTGNQVSTFEPVEVKTFILMLPIVLFSVLMQNYDKAKQDEKELAKYEPDAKTQEAQQHFLKL